jgi:hypothetical protein
MSDMQDIAGRTVDMRAEVGCLTRNVLVQGDAESPVDQYGAHIMLHSPPSGDLATTTGRISHIECYRCGQVLPHLCSLRAQLVLDCAAVPLSTVMCVA